MKRLSRYIREKPLESSCWCYFLLTFVPGALLGTEDTYAVDAVLRYLLPGSAAFAAAITFYGGRADALRLKGAAKSLIYCCPTAVLCLVNLAVGRWPEPFQPEQLFWLGSCALGEEVMGRMLLVSGITIGVRDRGWSDSTAIALAAILFGMMHAVNYAAQGAMGTVFQCCYTAAIGAVFAWSYQKSGCLWGGILWHTLLNLTGVSFP